MMNSLRSRWLLLSSSLKKLSHNAPSDSAAATRGARRRGWYRGGGGGPMGYHQQQQSTQNRSSSSSSPVITALKVIVYSYTAYYAYTQASSFINPKVDTATGKKKKQQQPLLCLQVESLDHKLQSYSDSFREVSTGTASNARGSMHRGRVPQLLEVQWRIPGCLCALHPISPHVLYIPVALDRGAAETASGPASRLSSHRCPAGECRRGVQGVPG